MCKNKIGIWHDFDYRFLKKNRRKKILNNVERKLFIKNLRHLGYCLSFSNKVYLKKIIKAFQRHFRPELINGIIDKESFAIAQNLAKKALKKA